MDWGRFSYVTTLNASDACKIGRTNGTIKGREWGGQMNEVRALARGGLLTKRAVMRRDFWFLCLNDWETLE